jgi:hypothetical protein
MISAELLAQQEVDLLTRRCLIGAASLGGAWLHATGGRAQPAPLVTEVQRGDPQAPAERLVYDPELVAQLVGGAKGGGVKTQAAVLSEIADRQPRFPEELVSTATAYDGINRWNDRPARCELAGLVRRVHRPGAGRQATAVMRSGYVMS